MDKKQRQNLIAIIIIIVAVIYAWNSFLMMPIRTQTKGNNSEIELTKNELQNLKLQSLQLPKIKRQLEHLQSEVQELEKYLPKERELPVLLKTITKIASRFGVRIINIAPAGISSQQNYTEHLFNLSIEGTYHSIAKFLAEMGQSRRITSARNINFSPLGVSELDAGEPTTSATFQLVAYTYEG